VATFIDALIDGFRQKRSESAEQELGQVAERLNAVQALTQQPGWAILIADLLGTERMLYHKWLANPEKLAPSEHAFMRLVRKLENGPQALLEEASYIRQSLNGGRE
jgi:hypothetical protein